MPCVSHWTETMVEDPFLIGLNTIVDPQLLSYEQFRRHVCWSPQLHPGSRRSNTVLNHGAGLVVKRVDDGKKSTCYLATAMGGFRQRPVTRQITRESPAFPSGARPEHGLVAENCWWELIRAELRQGPHVRSVEMRHQALFLIDRGKQIRALEFCKLRLRPPQRILEALGTEPQVVVVRGRRVPTSINHVEPYSDPHGQTQRPHAIHQRTIRRLLCGNCQHAPL
mmetsp:Transcript_120961/g.342205  ORF Transcript_120961/g.342205 Transcript_120961/m.342205 type:complete len:224 (-) Transcript_120961:411-1082(-)